MNYLNLETRVLHSPDFIGCEPTEQATWIKLMLYCATHENGGVLEDCIDWKCRRWQQTCGITLEEIQAKCALWTSCGNDVLVIGYPADIESKVIAKREAGAKGGRTSKQSADSASSKTAALLEAELQNTSNEKKRKEKEGKEKETATAELADADVAFVKSIYEKVSKLRSSWTLPLTYAERVAITNDHELFAAITDAHWSVIQQYLRASLTEGTPAWQPIKRDRFLESVSDVLQYALRWQEKRTPLPQLKTVEIRTVTDEERAETMKDFKSLFKTGS